MRIIIVLMLLAFTGCDYMYAYQGQIKKLKEEIAVSRSREEILAQTVKQLSYELDVLTTAYLEK